MKYFTAKKAYATLCLLPFLAACNPQLQANAQEKLPKERFTADDAVGSLAGIPLRMSSYIFLSFPEYEDTPHGLSKEWETYNPPTRTLKSPLRVFSIGWNIKTNELYDLRNQTMYDYSDSAAKPENPWIDFAFRAGKIPALDFLDEMLKIKLQYKPNLPEHSFKSTGEELYGLEVYKQLEPDTNTKTTDTLFIGRDKNGNVTTYISCFDNNKNEAINPPCSHDFLSGSNPYIKFTASYSRFYLKDWRKIESQSKKILESFADNAKHPKRKL
ncbi:hypothetical protein [uncultured Neisseria sp.]|uniref:hypothetical protein n=1 Tax=uncultured Neisseria sp. TaxID=237778 RepID=UPI0025F0FA6D|nr:hypothetical protein [uncultured Neisseria sp.]